MAALVLSMTGKFNKGAGIAMLKPGLIGAASIVFAFNASAFAVPLLLGGRRVQMMGVAIRDMISPLFDWSGAAASGGRERPPPLP